MAAKEIILWDAGARRFSSERLLKLERGIPLVKQRGGC